MKPVRPPRSSASSRPAWRRARVPHRETRLRIVEWVKRVSSIRGGDRSEVAPDAGGHPMKYVLMTYHSPDHVEAWERSTAEEKRLEIERTVAWFRGQAEAGRIDGGEELGHPRDARTVRRRG